MSVAVKKSAGFDAALSRFIEKARNKAEEAAVGMAKVAFDNLLKNSPQYSGDFAASWRVGYGAIKDYTCESSGSFPMEEPLHRGHPDAISTAKENATWGKLKLGQSIFISNTATHDEPYAMKIERGEITFRTVNMGSDHLVRRAHAYVLRRFGTIGPTQLAALRSVGV